MVLCGILVIGLWPFHAPKNEISWVSNGNGLHFGEYGSILSSVALKASVSKEGAPCGIEIWLQPSLDYSGTILASYLPDRRVAPFVLWQSHHNLGIQHANLDQFRNVEKGTIYATDVFRPGELVFITITSGPAGTTVYADGALVKRAPNFRFSSQDLSGQLIVGNRPESTNTWSGQLEGLAIYNRELSASEASQHYASWVQNTAATLAKSEGVIALYLFTERNGSVVHNQVDSLTSLLIPKRFFVLHEPFLETPWNEFFPTWGYWKNIGINIAGFVPFGFFFCAYFSSVRKIKRAVIVTVVLGFIVSLTIEVLQSFLPTRDSGMTDLITNTSGTALGSVLWIWSARYAWLARRTPAIDFSVGEGNEGTFAEQVPELCKRDA